MSFVLKGATQTRRAVPQARLNTAVDVNRVQDGSVAPHAMAQMNPVHAKAAPAAAAPAARFNSREISEVFNTEARTDLADRVKSRRLNLRYTGSMQDFANEANAALLKQSTHDRAAKLFPVGKNDLEAERTEAPTDKCIIRAIRVTNVTNPFSFPVAVDCSAGHLNQTADRDDSFCLVACGADERTRGVSDQVYSVDESFESRQFEEYGNWTMAKLREKVRDINPTTKLVRYDKNPILRLMDMNAEELGHRMDENDLQDFGGEKFVQIPAAAVDQCLSHLDEMVISQFSYTNMADLTFSLNRADGKAWDSPTNASVAGMEIKAERTVSIGLEIDYMYPTV